MGIPARLSEFLASRGISYRAETHPEAFTAQQTAQVAHVPGGAYAKAVLLNVDGRLQMAVLPAPDRVDIKRFQACVGARKVRLATEAEFTPVFPDCDIGAMPIFGSLYGIPVLLSHQLAENEEIAFTAGTHRDVVRVRVKDFLEAEKPRVCEREELLSGVG